MKYIADLHVHSKYSRATAKSLDLEHLYIAAQLKGITVVGTGDFTYPQWFEEIRRKLVPAEQGLFKLKDELASECDRQVPRSCRGTVRFILATEISNIYKKNEKTRKNHNLVLVPGLDVAERFSVKLDRIGNIKSDGRPILGLDARDLLEILLDTSEQAMLIPAHIWTPWFSMLGSKSGFDSVKECFEDLTPHIFAVETGLSSDPPMNWRVSDLDGLTLVSNSDAHSPLNLGREANLFDADLSYAAIKAALQSGNSRNFLGTFEFYPEEGKYHLDGHRNCKVCLWPEKTIRHDGLCPQCGKPLTLGVLYRVEQLADRPYGAKPEKHLPYHSIIPLVDILSEIFRVGPKSKKVSQALHSALDKLGSELNILHYLDPSEIDTAGIPLLGEAVRRMRQKKIEVNPGYDGEYGKVKIFSEDERQKIPGQQTLFHVASGSETSDRKPEQKPSPLHEIGVDDSTEQHNVAQPGTPAPEKTGEILGQLNDEQRRAVVHPCGPLMIVAGPGTGKTRTLTHRIAYLIRQRDISPLNILAVTFTNKAAEEMRGRLQALIGDDHPMPFVATFHGLCLSILNELNSSNNVIIVDEGDRLKLISESLRIVASSQSGQMPKTSAVLKQIVAAKQQIMDPDDVLNTTIDGLKSKNRLFVDIYRVYQDLLTIQGLCDYEDLIFHVVRRLESDQEVCSTYRDRFRHIFVDEYQDLNQSQYRIIRALAPDQRSSEDICVIGDPDQSIYGFRGSDSKYFSRFVHDYPRAAVIRLTRNYRSTETILGASFQVIRAHQDHARESRTYSQIDGIRTISILELDNEKKEAETIARTIENLVGGTGFHSIDTGKIDDANISQAQSYSDFAVLYRTHAQHRVIADVFDSAGIPFQVASKENIFNQPGLPELVSYLKVIEGRAAYTDHEKIMHTIMPGIWKKTRKAFKDWCYRNRFSLQQGLSQAKRFPIPGLSTANQQTLIYFSNQFEELAKKLAEKKVSEKLDYLVNNTKLSSIVERNSQSMDALEKLMHTAEQFDIRTTDFIAALALDADTDVYASRVEKVSLMTMHAAKGLEFPIVFISGCEQGLIPYELSGGEPRDIVDINEERRLFYVAMTRAMTRLYFTRAKSRNIYGRLESRSPSRFVNDIEIRLKKDESPRIAGKKKKTDQKQLSLF
jgi:uncharacterized protein (TIGR00375 family)